MTIPSVRRPSRRAVLKGSAALAAGVPLASALSSCGSGTGGEKGVLTIWWNQGKYAAEDTAMREAVATWERQSGHRASFQLYGTTDIQTKLQSATATNNPPDVAFGEGAWLMTLYAWQGRLLDLSDVIEPSTLTDAAKESVHLYNKAEERFGHYALPVHQQVISPFYWKDLVTDVGLDPAEAPRDWEGYWAFWKAVQDAYRERGVDDVYSFGWTMASGAGDTNNFMEQVLRSYDVSLLDSDNRLRVDDPDVRDGVVSALRWISGLYVDGYAPPGCVTWDNNGNNAYFLRRSTVLTPNGSLSIPGSIQENDPELGRQVVTDHWPDRAVGGTTVPIALPNNVIALKDGRNNDLAKDFVRFLSDPVNTEPVILGGNDRWIATDSQLLRKPHWARPTNPGVRTVAEDLRTARPSWTLRSAAYNRSATLGVWARALGRIALTGTPPKEAADEALDRMKGISTELDRV